MILKTYLSIKIKCFIAFRVCSVIIFLDAKRALEITLSVPPYIRESDGSSLAVRLSLLGTLFFRFCSVNVHCHNSKIVTDLVTN